jgi:lysyl-tRNA synthetase class 1
MTHSEKQHWADAEGDQVLKQKKEYHLSTGITPSGEIHVGNLREVLTADAIYRVLQERGIDADFHYIADDFDPLRKVYPFLKSEIYDRYVGMPLSEIPCPCGNHENYADHFLQPFIHSLKELRVPVKIYRGSETYKSGRMNSLIIQALKNREKIMDILHRKTGKVYEEDWHPFNARCQKCGSMNGTKITSFSEKDQSVSYVCGCGDKGSAPMAGGGKLTWRIDWPARWKLYNVTVEPFGKDHATRGGSYDTGAVIVREVFNGEPPYPIPYEWISLHGMGVMASSKGNVLSIDEALHILPPEILRYMILRVKPIKTISFDPGMPVLYLIDEYDDKESKRRNDRAIELSRAAGFPPMDIPFRHIVTVAQIAEFDPGRVRDIVQGRGYVVQDSDALQKRMSYARRWLEKFAPDEMKFQVKRESPAEVKHLSSAQKNFLSLLADSLKEDMSGEEIHQLIYSLSKKVKEEEPARLFQAIYISLLGKMKGPRAGSFLSFLDHRFVVRRFQQAALP